MGSDDEKRGSEDSWRDQPPPDAEIFMRIVESAPWGMHFYNLKDDGRLVFTGANPSAEKMLGINHRDLMGLTLDEAFPARTGRDLTAVYSEVARSGKSWHSEEVDYEDDKIKGAFEVFAFQTSPGQMVAAFQDITARKRAEELSRASEQRMRMLVENSPMAVVEWDSNFVVTRWAGEAEKVFGWTASETVGRPIMDLNIIYPEDMSIVERVMNQLMDGVARHVVSSNRNLTKDGRTVHCTWYNSVIHDSRGRMHSVLSFVLDNTARIEAEAEAVRMLEAVKQEKERLQFILDSLPVGVSMADAAGRTILRNRRVDDILRGPVPTSRTIADFAQYAGRLPETAEHLQPEEWPMARSISKGETVENQEIEMERADGGTATVIVSSLPVKDEQGKIVGGLAAFMDITRQKQVERDLARSNTELQSFAYAASHDLREPLRTISGFLELLEMDYGPQLDDKAKDYISRAVSASARLHRMIDDILAYSRLETRKREFGPADLNAVLKSVLHDLDRVLKDNSATVTSGDLPRVWGDESQLAIVLRNLIDNAVKFHGPAPPKVHISAERQKGEWLISVKDNGIGVDPANQGKIFNMFVRLQSHKMYPGTGIGLAMCKKIVERHNGRIWVESEVGKGSSFEFALPERRFAGKSHEGRREQA